MEDSPLSGEEAGAACGEGPSPRRQGVRRRGAAPRGTARIPVRAEVLSDAPVSGSRVRFRLVLGGPTACVYWETGRTDDRNAGRGAKGTVDGSRGDGGGGG